MAGHISHIDVENTAFRGSLYAIDKNSIFQQFFLFEYFENIFKHTVAKRPAKVQAFGQTQMHNVFCIDSLFILSATKSTAATVRSSGLRISTAGAAYLWMVNTDVSCINLSCG